MHSIRYLAYTIALILYGILANAVLSGASNLTKKEKNATYVVVLIVTFIIATRYNRL